MSTNDLKTTEPLAEHAEEKKERKHIWPGVIAILTLLLVVIFLGTACYLYKKEIQSQRLAVRKQAVEFDMALSRTQKIVLTQQKALAVIQDQLKHQQRAEKSDEEYLGEAEHFVRLAMFTLIFESNAATAHQLLQAADEKIQSITDMASSLPIRQALAKDMVAVQMVQQVDLPGLVSRLNALSAQVELLPHLFEPAEVPSSGSPESPARTEEVAVSPGREKLNRAGDTIAQVFSKLFVITHNVPQAAPLLPPDQYVYVITNIQSKLAVAEWGVLYRQPEIYKQSLAQAETWVRRYFADNHSETQAFLKALDALLMVSIKPDLPDLTGTLKQIELARRKGDVVVESSAEEKTDARKRTEQPQSSITTEGFKI
ncbi:MAG: hypothetical protein K0Q74_916 [Gammaproteobacteria bacterium]|jgi:uroporphyrin-3 C-methyltransferase|nr:hypothetical protein [Gammaproteobacteria bacterium]